MTTTTRAITTMFSMALFASSLAVPIAIDEHPSSSRVARSAQGSIVIGGTVVGDTSGAASLLGGISSDHTYSFQVATAGIFVFDSCGSSYDTWLRIYDTVGNQVTSGDDDGGCGLHTILTSPTLPAGSYTLLVEGYASHSGSYTVTMRQAESHHVAMTSASTQGSISCGGPAVIGSTAGHSSYLGGASADHTYSFQVATAGIFVFDSCGSSYDTWLRIYDAVGNQVASGDDDGGCGLHTILTSPTLPAGSYTLLVEGYAIYEGSYTVTMSGNCGPEADAPPSDNLMKFAKVNTQSTQTSNGGTAVDFTFPITAAVVGNLSPESDAVSMRCFGTGQLAEMAWSEVQAWIAPITPPTHAGSTGTDGAAFWREFEQIVDMQTARRYHSNTPPLDNQCATEHGICACTGLVWYGSAPYVADLTRWSTRVSTGSISCWNGVFGDPLPGAVKACYCAAGGPMPLASDYLVALPSMFADHTIAAAAAEVEKDFPTKFPTMLVEQFLGEGVRFDADVVPHTGDDFVNKVVMLANVIGWAVSVVSPTAFGSKWQVGRARPEEVAWAVHSGDSHVADAPSRVADKIEALDLVNVYNFTAYSNGSPKHPSWPAMHSAASSASLYLAVLLDLNDDQLAEARNLDCAVASFRTLAGVHYESDNMAGLSIGQEVIRRELPGYLAERYGSNPLDVTAKIDDVIAAHDWRNAPSCFRQP